MRKGLFRSVFVFIVVAWLLNPALYAKKGTDGNINLSGFPQFVEKQMKEQQVPGMAIAVVKDGKVVFARGFGYRDVDKKLPVTADTLFAIGSSTKAFTATVVGILVDEGKLAWDKPIRHYLPDFKLQDPIAMELMTPIDLLCHHSGLPRHDLMWYNSSTTREELFQRLQYLEPNTSFRSTFQYNNLMFMSAGVLAGKMAGTSWEELVQTKIFAPLGMKNSNFSVKDSQKSPDFALPYQLKDEKVMVIPFRTIDNIGPAGAINSSVNEMAQWLLLNLNKGKIGDKQIVSEASMAQIHAPHQVTGAPLSKYPEMSYRSYGLGWFVSTYRGHPLIEHGGTIDGFITGVAFFPRQNAGLVVLTNSLDAVYLSTIVANNLYDRILGLPQIPWAQRTNEAKDSRKKSRAAIKDKKDEDRKPNTTPSHPLEDYTGEYENPGYGIIKFEKEGTNLMVTLNNMSFKCLHYHYDIFEMIMDIFNGQKMKVTFHSDLKGNITRLSIPLEPSVKDIEFTRVPDK